jgi:hypothetical protein
VFVDATSIMYLNGCRVDYVETLEGAGFKFENPNVKSTCAAGRRSTSNQMSAKTTEALSQGEVFFLAPKKSRIIHRAFEAFRRLALLATKPTHRSPRSNTDLPLAQIGIALVSPRKTHQFVDQHCGGEFADRLASLLTGSMDPR